MTSCTGSARGGFWKMTESCVLPRKKKVDFRLFAVALCRVRTCFGVDGKVCIERLYLSSYVEKLFNSEVIKSFVPEIRSCKSFSYFGIPMVYIYIYIYMFMMSYEHSMYISHIFMDGYVTFSSISLWHSCLFGAYTEIRKSIIWFLTSSCNKVCTTREFLRVDYGIALHYTVYSIKNCKNSTSAFIPQVYLFNMLP